MSATNGPIPVSQAGNGIQVDFDFAFKIFSADDIIASKGDALDVFTLGVLGVDYTVAFDTEAETGTVTWLVAPVAGGASFISRSSARTQGSTLPREGPMPEKTIENALDKLTLVDQEQEEKLSRALIQASLPPGALPITIEAPVDAKGLRWRDDGGGNFVIESTAFDPDEQASGAAVSAAASAVLAQNAAQAAIWRDVVFLTSVDSPRAVTNADRGKLLSVDASGGSVIINLPSIVSLDLTSPFNIGVKKTDAGVNTVTINRAVTDTIDGAVAKVLGSQNAGATFVPDTGPAPDIWTTLDIGTVPDASVTTIKLNDAVFSGLTATAPATGDYVALSDVSAAGVKRKALVSDILALIPAAASGPTWTKYTKTFADFSAAALTNSITLFTAPAGTVIHAVKIKHTTAFSGGAISAYNVGLGITGGLQKYASDFGVFQAAAGNTFQLSQTLHSENHAATWDVKATATAVGANLDAATAGSVDIWVLASVAV